MTTPGLRALKANVRSLTRERDLLIQQVRNTYAKEVRDLQLKKNEQLDKIYREYEETVLKLRGEWRESLKRAKGE